MLNSRHLLFKSQQFLHPPSRNFIHTYIMMKNFRSLHLLIAESLSKILESHLLYNSFHILIGNLCSWGIFKWSRTLLKQFHPSVNIIRLFISTDLSEIFWRRLTIYDVYIFPSKRKNKVFLLMIGHGWEIEKNVRWTGTTTMNMAYDMNCWRLKFLKLSEHSS